MPDTTDAELAALIGEHEALAERAMPPAFRLICQTALLALREFQALRKEIAVHRQRARECDAFCGAMNRVAEGWYRAEKEFALEDEGPFEAVERLQSEITALRGTAVAIGTANEFLSAQIEAMGAELDELREPHGPVARPLAEWHEDDGPVMWWAFPIVEPPYIGTPLDNPQEMSTRVWMDGKPAYTGHRKMGGWSGLHTHWTPLGPLPSPPQEPPA